VNLETLSIFVIHGPSKICHQRVHVEYHSQFNCKNGGFDSNRHNEVRDLEATVLLEVCKDVSIEPLLQPLTSKHYRHRTTNIDDNARARGFWRRGQLHFFMFASKSPISQKPHDTPSAKEPDSPSKRRNEHTTTVLSK
jgi:hypothetical protein